MELLYRGKVRDLYEDDGDLILVATDRVSVFDMVLPTPIPDKGEILTALTLWWAPLIENLVFTHVISDEVPQQWAGRAIRCERLAMLPVECVVRGHLAGSAWVEYQQHGTVGGIELPRGLAENDELPGPLFTVTTKAVVGRHDEPLTMEQFARLVGVDVAQYLRRISVALFVRASGIAGERGVIIADTKFEFGVSATGRLVLADEILTPDSSRFWLTEHWERGAPVEPYDKQIVRNWAAGTGWDRQSVPPEIPPEIVDRTRARYIEVYQRLTGSTLFL